MHIPVLNSGISCFPVHIRDFHFHIREDGLCGVHLSVDDYDKEREARTLSVWESEGKDMIAGNMLEVQERKVIYIYF